LWDLFHTPELAAQVTLLPIDILGVDAAILFSDILVILEAFGAKLSFPEGKGPQISPLLTDPSELKNLSFTPPEESLHFVKKTIEIVRQKLDVPLIGFCGGPFTVASYFIESTGKTDLPKTKDWLYRDPKSFHQLLDMLTEASIAYLKMQIKAGVQAIQIFDSWANVLPESHLLEFSFHYLKKIVKALEGYNIPIILFCRGSSLFPKQLAELNPQAISFDWQKPLHTLRAQVPSHIAVQGNLDPHLLKAPKEVVLEEAKKILKMMRGEPGFIFNLGHGVLPETPVENVQALVELVKKN
jgi:uroporphyrinogen decarboxylase